MGDSRQRVGPARPAAELSSVKPRRPDPRTARTREAFRQALLDSIHEGETAPTVRILCDRTGLNRSTFYLHYDDLEELAEDVARSIVATVVDNWQALLRSQPDAFTRVSKEHMTSYLEHIDQNRTFYRWIFGEQGAWVAVRSALDDYTNAILTSLQTDVTDPQERLRLASLLGGALFGAVLHWVKEPATMTPAEMADWIWMTLEFGSKARIDHARAMTAPA